MKRILLIWCLCWMSILSAGEKKDAALKKITEHINSRGRTPWTWVFYGDSITHGARHTYGWRSFQEIFHERIRGEFLIKRDLVINSGSSGYTVKELLNDDYYNWALKRFNPQVVFLLIGMNDAPDLKSGGSAEFRQRLEKLVRRIQDDGAIIVLQTYNTIEYKPETPSYKLRYERLSAFNQAIRDVAQQYDLILVDHDKYWRENAADPDILHFWLGEMIHPGARGHLEMANLIFKELNIFDPHSSCSSVEAGGKFPLKSGSGDMILIKNDFSDFVSGAVPARKNVQGGIWYSNIPSAYTIINEGVDNSPCLRVMRDGAAGIGAFYIDRTIPAERNRKLSFKLKVASGQGVALSFVQRGKAMAGGALFVGDAPVCGYNKKGKWEDSGIAGNFPVDQWVTCEIDFNSAAQNYVISFVMPDGKRKSGSVKHPFMDKLQVNEVRFLNILPQKSFSLIDDFEFLLK